VPHPGERRITIGGHQAERVADKQEQRNQHRANGQGQLHSLGEHDVRADLLAAADEARKDAGEAVRDQRRERHQQHVEREHQRHRRQRVSTDIGA
jgi:hypothetical protein